MALAGHVSRAMMERYSHIRMEAKRRAVNNLSGTDFKSGVVQNWAQFFISERNNAAECLLTISASVSAVCANTSMDFVRQAA